MILRTLWIHRKGEDMPEMIVAWDEYSEEQNSQGFQDACDKELALVGSEATAHRYIDINVTTELIDDAFKVPRIEGIVEQEVTRP